MDDKKLKKKKVKKCDSFSAQRWQVPMLGTVYGGQAAYRPVRLVHPGLAGPEDALRAAAVAQARGGAGAGGGVKEMVC